MMGFLHQIIIIKHSSALQYETKRPLGLLCHDDCGGSETPLSLLYRDNYT